MGSLKLDISLASNLSKCRLTLLTILLCAVLLTVQAQEAERSEPIQTSSMAALDDKRPLTAGDVLTYRVVEDRNQGVGLLVKETGEVDLPLIGNVKAAGRTCRQLAYAIKSILDQEYYYDATVIVSLDSFSNRPRGVVYMRGAIANATPIPIQPNEELMLSKAILRAGGFTTYSNKRKVTVLRRKPGTNESETITVDMKQVLEEGKLDGDIALQPDDIVTVHQRGIVF